MKHKSYRPAIVTRELPPKLVKTDKGLKMMCPFCVPSHPIVPGQMAPCGTVVKVSAVQTVIPARTANERKLVCLKCKKAGGGPMVPAGAGYVHQEDCTPGTHIITEVPPYDKRAERVFKMKDGLWKRIQVRLYGKPACVDEVDEHGNKTGKVLSYFFQKA